MVPHGALRVLLLTSNSILVSHGVVHLRDVALTVSVSRFGVPGCSVEHVLVVLSLLLERVLLSDWHCGFNFNQL